MSINYLYGGSDNQFAILDITIDDIEYSENKTSTNEDREIFLLDAGIQARDIEYFSHIDEIIDYKQSRFSGYYKQRDLLKLCAEFMTVGINLDDMHSVYVKKSKDYYRDSLKDIKLNNAKYIINKNTKQQSIEIITVPFISKVYVNNLKKTLLYPANKKIKVQGCKGSIIHGRDNTNYFHIELNKVLNSDCVLSEKFKYQIKGETLQDSITRIMNYYKNKSLYNQIYEDSVYVYGFETEKYKDIDDRLLFLKSKPIKNGDMIENLYYCFDIDNKLNLLEKIIHKGMEHKENNYILQTLQTQNIYAAKYEKELDILIKQNAKNSRLEQICKKRYPNFFNPASKDFIFSKHSSFNVSHLPVHVQKSLNTEYNVVKEIEEKMSENKCLHKRDIQHLRNSGMDKSIWYNFKDTYISKDNKNSHEFCSCSSCSYPLICPHEIDYYDLYFNMYKEDSVNYINKINQILTTKYSPKNEKKGNQNYSFCKICGMEIVKILDTEGMNYTESEAMYKGESSNNRFGDSDEKRIIMSVINRNLSFSKPVSRTVLNGVVNGIYESIMPITFVLNKKKKKESSVNEEQYRLIELNLTIMTIVSIMTLSMKYDFIEFKKILSKRPNNANIIIKKNNGKLNIGDKFREAWDIFYDRYKNLLRLNTGKNNIESFKKVFIKCYDLLKETIGENIYISDGNISAHTSPSAISEYSINLWKKSKKNDKELEYKKLSDGQFIFALENNLFSVFLTDRNENDSYWKKFYIENSELIKIEKILIQKNIQRILYPYWKLPYSYERYYKKDLSIWSKDMSLYACPSTGKRHNWNIYKFKSKKGDLYSYKIKDISKNDSDLDVIKEGKLLSLQCSDCSMDTVDLLSKFGNDDYYKTIEKQVNFINDIQSFYSTYKYRCLNASFHSFKQVIENNQNTYICSECGIKFSYILNLDKDFYIKNSKKYISFINSLEERKNKEIESHKLENEKTNNINLQSGRYGVKEDKQLINISLDKRINNIKQISSDKKVKQCIHNLGKTELADEEIYYSSDINLNGINDMFSKTIDRLRQIIIYIGIFIKNPYKHKFYKRDDFIEALDFVDTNKEAKGALNIIHEYLSKDKILDSVYSYSVSHPDGKLGSIHYTKSIILYVMEKISKYDKIFKFFINNIIDSDLLYTNYNYAELKKTYNMNKLAEDSINSIDELDADENNDSMNLNISKDKTEGFELFEMSDLSMNNFEDDDIE